MRDDLQVHHSAIKRLVVLVIDLKARWTIGEKPMQIDLLPFDRCAGVGLSPVAPLSARDVNVPRVFLDLARFRCVNDRAKLVR